MSPPELTEGEGYHHLLAEKRESVASRAEDFVNNYYGFGFGDAGYEDNDPRLTADAARWQGQADAFFARQEAIERTAVTADAARWQGQADAFFARQKAIERTAEKYAHGLLRRRPPHAGQLADAGESVASRAEDFVNNYYGFGFGDAGEMDRTKVASMAPDSPVARPETGLSTEAVVITFFTLLLLVTGVTIMIVRRGNYRPAT